MRTRSSISDPVVCTSTGKQRSAATPLALSTAPWTFPTGGNGNSFLQDSKSITDQKTPGYFKAKRENTLIPCSPMNSSKTEHLWSPGYCHHNYRWSTGTYYEKIMEGYWWPSSQQWGIAPTAPTIDVNVPLQEALSRAQSDCYDALTMAAEFRKTVAGVVTLHSRAQTIWTQFEDKVRSSSKSKRFRGMEMAQILSAIWLELRYMWRPLVYDMIAAEEAYRRLTDGVETPLQRSYATRSSSSSTSRVVTSSSVSYKTSAAGGMHANTCRSVQSVTCDVTVHAAVGLKVTTREISMADPIVTGWELVPFSFVFDWFVTIGDMLTAFSPFATGQLQYATVSTTKVFTFRCVNTLSPQSGSTLITEHSSIPCVQQRIDTTYNRVLSTPVPTLAFDVNLDASKIVDLVALVLVSKRKSLTRMLRYF